MVASRDEASRDECVDTARGLACLLLVAYHVIGSSPDVGLRAGNDSYWRFVADLLMYIRMPMFAFISGYVYGWQPFAEDPKHFLIGKARRLLLPTLVVGTIFAVVQSLTPGANFVVKNWATLHIVPVSHYWFLEPLFIIFTVVMVLDVLKLLRDQTRFLSVLAAATAIQVSDAHFADPVSLVFGLAGAVYLLPYFLCGLACTRLHIEAERLLPVAIIVFVGTFAYAAAGMLGYVPLTVRNSIVALPLGASASFAVLNSGWKNRGLVFIGMSGYAIYLFHPFFTASTRMAMHWLHVQDIDMLVVALTITGILGPILIKRLANRFAVTRTALLGRTWTGSMDRLWLTRLVTWPDR
jgi:fucose 4-O-acetylase-like acetyltransferase